MANKKLRGTIEAVARNGKGFKIEETWYTAYKAVQLKGAQKGDEVEFEYAEKDVGGTTFYNVQGDVKVVGASTSSSAGSSSSGGSRTSAASSGYAGGVGDAARQKSIIRQNSLTQANALVSTYPELIQNDNAEQAALELVEIAKVFEAYSSGSDE